ncbi:MAG: aminotransferase class III-fold pyridoxal phosphate-dependent enzyme [Candidatus Kapabacteria bacterium]|nr:aminotransferase class III-fold pyridoxal phosphate-dependent enzyme [Candidatus Kapabacteria bacterium]
MHEPTYPPIQRSTELLQRAERLIPATTQTLAKGPGQHVRGVAPVYARRGRGAYLWDVDDNRYLDYSMAIGPLILGYADPGVNRAIEAQLHDGITFSLMHPLEVEVAEMIHAVVPNAEHVRYSKTGCDVTSAAVRLARAYTGRSTVLCCGYHGWHDWYIATTDRAMGIPQAVRDLTYTFSYNNMQSVYDAIDADTAAIILEPMTFDEPNGTFLQELRQLCDQRGIVLIFDEMWTGFRVSPGGAQMRFGVDADLACFSKAVANGMPLSVLTGKAEIMRLLEHDVFFFTTFGGEALSLAAAKATLHRLFDGEVLQRIELIGDELREGVRALLADNDMTYVSCKGLGARTMLAFSDAAGDPLLMRSFVQQELLKHGILWNGFHNLSASHTPSDIQYTLDIYAEVLPMLHEHVRMGTLAMALRGRPVEPVFRKTGGFNTKPRVAVEH